MMEARELVNQERAIVPVNNSIAENFPLGNEKDNLMEWLKILSGAPFYKDMGLPGMMAIVLTGRELGVGPMASLNGGFHNIQGRIAMSSEMMRAKFRTADHALEIVELTATACTMKGTRTDGKGTCTMSYTMEDATIAGLVNKDNWKKHPKDMLVASCGKKIIRFLAPELLAGTGVDDYETIEIKEVESKLVSPEVLVDEPVSLEVKQFIIDFKLLDPNSDGSEFIEYIVERTGEDRKIIITNASKNVAGFEANLKRFKKPVE